MTLAQEKAIQKFKEWLERNIKRRNEGTTVEGFPGYEIKEFKVKEDDHNFVSIIVETGVKNDKGNWNSILSRQSALIFVGNRGGFSGHASRFQKNKKMLRMRNFIYWLDC